MCLQKGGVCKSFANAYILRLVCKRRLFSANAAILQTRTNIYMLFVHLARQGLRAETGYLAYLSSANKYIYPPSTTSKSPDSSGAI